MAAKYDERDGVFYVHTGHLDFFVKEQLLEAFEDSASQNEQNIYREMRETKALKAVCLVKTLLFPMEALLTRIICNKTAFKDVVVLQKLQWAMLRNKLSLEAFVKALRKNNLA